MQTKQDVVVRLSETVRAWIANTNRIDTGDLERLQQVFGNNLDIIHANDGRAIVFPSHGGDRSKFDVFMEATGRFEQRPVQLNAI